MSKIVILPSCDDGNRGDQALVWQTRELAQRAGLADECLMLSNDPNRSTQSEAEGIDILSPILVHPSAKSSVNNNVGYGVKTLVVWGSILFFDSVRSLLLLTRLGRLLLRATLSDRERRTISEISTADACFVKGGGFIHSTNSITDPFKAFFFLYHIMLAQSLHTPVFVMPNSFGPFNDPIYRYLVRRVLSKCELVTTRESISQKTLESLGVKSVEFPDLAFGLRPERPAKPYLDQLVKGNEDRPIVGLTARPYRFPDSADPVKQYQIYIDEMARFTNWLYENGFFPVFIEHVISKGAHESDMAAITEITEKLDPGTYALFSDQNLTARQMRAVYSECDYVVGTRFHSVIFSLAEHVPAMAIAYGGNKGTGIMKDIGFADYVVNIEDFSAVRAISIFGRIVDDSSFKARLIDLDEQVSSKYEDLVELIKSTR